MTMNHELYNLNDEYMISKRNKNYTENISKKFFRKYIFELET